MRYGEIERKNKKEKGAQSVQSGLWGYETSSGNIPQPRLSHGGNDKKKLGFYAVNFAAL